MENYQKTQKAKSDVTVKLHWENLEVFGIQSNAQESLEETLDPHPLLCTLSQAVRLKAQEARGQWKHTPVSLPCRPDNLAWIVEQIAISKHTTTKSIRDNKALPCYSIRFLPSSLVHFKARITNYK